MAKIVFFSKTSPRGPSSRYRIYQYLPLLKARGIEAEVKPLFDDFYFKIIEVKSGIVRVILKTFYSLYSFIKRIFQLFAADKSNIAVVEHQLFPYIPAFLELIFINYFHKRYVEFDDAVYLTFLHKKKFEKMLPAYNGVIAGNKNLASFALRKNQDVVIHPTLIDVEKASPKKDYAISGKAVIGWIGLAWNFKYLKLIHEALKDISLRHEVILKVVSSRPLHLEGICCEFEEWSMDTEWKSIRNCDIGIMPLEDDEWCRGKCGLKLLQYMACAMPTVSAPVGVNEDIIDDGISGFLASDKGEWIEKVEKLILSEELRRRMGTAGREKAIKGYSLQKKGGDVVSFYESLSGKSD